VRPIEEAGNAEPGGLRARLERQRELTEIQEDLGFDGHVCPSCGARNPADATACIVCGENLSQPVAYQIVGAGTPAVEITLEPGQTIYAETGCLGWMTDTVQMRTVAAGSPWALLGRAMAGMTALISEFTAEGAQGLVALTPRFPGRIIPLQVTPERDFIVQRGGFLAAQRSVRVSPFFQRDLGVIFFGGEGFVLQRHSGSGTVFVQIDGEVVQYELQPGQRMLVNPGSIGAFEGSVNFRLTTVKGVTNVLFNEGLFLASLEGPGQVWLQTMPFARVISNITAHIKPNGE
jgi:uncharacterized protein (TIGR00266 family)